MKGNQIVGGFGLIVDVVDVGFGRDAEGFASINLEIIFANFLANIFPKVKKSITNRCRIDLNVQTKGLILQ